MSIFTKVTAEPAPEELATRYTHLCEYAKMLLGDCDLEPLRQRCELDDGLTRDKLNFFQQLINSAADQQQYRDEVKVHFAIDSKESLDWYLGQKQQHVAELEGYRAQYEKLINSVQSRLKGLEFLYQQQAEIFAMAEYERTGVKTTVLPHGTVAIRSTKPAWSIENETALQAWLHELTPESKEVYGVTPKTWNRNLEKLKALAEQNLDKEDGVTVPGLKRDPGGNKVSLRLPKEKDND